MFFANFVSLVSLCEINWNIQFEQFSLISNKKLKTLLPVAILLACFFCSCNNKNNSKTATDEKPAADTGLSLLINLSSSNALSQLLCQNWQSKEDVDDGILSGSGDDGLQIPFHGFCFFDDGSVVQNPRDNNKTGKWVMDEKTKKINIIFNDGSKNEYLLNAIGVKNLLLKTGKEPAVKFLADGKKYINNLNDPFYPANNKWRIKPAHVETDSAVKHRVIECVLFYNKFFQDHVNRKLPVISFYGLPSCFKWYQGGISIINKAKMSPKWMDCFYNKDQAEQGQQLLENIISKKYNWNRNEANWVKQSADVLLQVADSLK